MKKMVLMIYAFVAIGVLLVANPVLAAPTKNETQAVAKIMIYGDAGWVYSGSGVVIDAKGDIVTNYHVVAQKIQNPSFTMLICTTINPAEPPGCGLRAEIQNYWAEADLALLRLTEISVKDIGWISIDEYRLRYGSNPSFLTYVKIDKAMIEEEGVVLTDKIHILGYPGVGGSTITYTEGSVSGFERLSTDEGYIPYLVKTDAQINHGNSGGGAFDSENKFVGIPTLKFDNIGYLISVSLVNKFLFSSLGNSYLNSSQSDLPTNAFEGVFGGYVEGTKCPQFSTGVYNSHSCQCNTGFFAVGNSCIPATRYCSIKGGTYSYYIQKCEGIPVKQVKESITSAPAEVEKQCVGGAIPNASGCVCPSGQVWDVVSGTCSGVNNIKPTSPQTVPNPFVSQSTVEKVKYFIGTPKTKGDLMNCLVVGNKTTKTYYLRGNKLIKNMSPKGKYCFDDESLAIKSKYKKVK